MNTTKSLIVSHFNSESRSHILSYKPLLSTKKLVSKGVNFDYYQYGAFETPIHVNEHHVISLVLDSIKNERKLDGVYSKEEQNFGSVAVIPAKAEHWSAWKTPARFVLFSIQPQVLAQIAPETVNPDKVELLPAFAKSEPDRLVASISMAIKQQLENDPDGCDFYVEHLFNALLAHLVKNYCTITSLFKEYTGGLPPYKLRQAINYINDNLDQKIKLDDVAKLIDISQYYFCHLFKESTGIAPYQYVIKQRIAKAKELTKQSKLPLAEIAFECGFSSQSQMTQHFRRSVGVTPKVYRDRQ